MSRILKRLSAIAAFALAVGALGGPALGLGEPGELDVPDLATADKVLMNYLRTGDTRAASYDPASFGEANDRIWQTIAEIIADMQSMSLTPGPAGPTGPAGADGTDGRDGAAGADGVPGPIGPAGPTGPAGADGADGRDGAAGADGVPGPIGPAGPAGPAGPTGPAGADGVPGPAGIGGAVIVKGPGAPIDPYLPATATALCPSETPVALGGGFDTQLEFAQDTTTLRSSVPVGHPGSPPTGWSVTIQAVHAYGWVYAYAICAQGVAPPAAS